MPRRTFVAGLGALALPRVRLPQSPSPLRWSPLGADAWVVDRGGGNSTVLRERSGAIVIDCKLGGVGAALEREVRAKVGPIQAVIITHHHADHSEGLPAFPTERSYAHRAGAERIRADLTAFSRSARASADKVVEQQFASLARDFDYPRNPATERDVRAFASWAAAAAPTDRTPAILLGERAEIPIGSTTLEVVHPGPAHTDNDVFVIDRRRNLVLTGDLLFHRHHPFIDTDAGATTVGWQRAIDQILASAPRKAMVVPGHGPVTDLTALATQRRYFEVVRDLVQKARDQGRTRKEIIALPNTPFAEYRFDDLWSANLGVLYDEISAAP